jgi:putative ABC transport system permease protein
MNTVEAIRIALMSLWANKLRSVLTLLGVVIGVAAVIAVVTFVSGINGYVADKIFNLGADVFIVSKTSPVIRNMEQFMAEMKRKDLTMDDYHAVQDYCRHCTIVGATTSGGAPGKVKYGNQSGTQVGIRGATASMGPILDTEVVMGRYLNDTDVNYASSVAVIGYDIVDNILVGTDPLGKEINIDGRLYTVIGVGKRQGKTLGQSQDNYAIIPISTFMHQYGGHRSIRIMAKANGIGPSLEAAMDESRAILRARRHDYPGKADTFAVENNASLMSIWEGLSSTFFYAMIGIAAISLVVGGIVIMNIMLVSVTERTREIGVRKALGARRLDVMRQFLIESATMAVVGGAIGVLGGTIVAKTVTLLIGMPSRIELWSVLAGLFVAASVGIFFGVYPAKRAAALDPIVALRSEL